MKKITHVLKHTFIPHEHNEYKPHFFREASVISIALVGVFMLGISAGSSFFLRQTVLGVNIATSVLVDLTNENRLAYNQEPLVRNTTLDAAATLKANDMVYEGYFAHDSPKGIAPWHWFGVVGYKFLYAGENLAVNFTESRDVQQAWLDSPTHRANLLNVNFKEIGMAAVEGVYKGNKSIFVVQMFGTPAHAEGGVENKSAPPEASSTPLGDIASNQNSLEKVATVESVSGEDKQSQAEKLVLGQEAEIVPILEVEQEQVSKTITKIVPVVSGPSLAVVKTVTVEVQPNASGTGIEENISGGNEKTQNVNDVIPFETTKNAEENSHMREYSTWYEKAIFFTTKYIDIFYKALLILVGIALCTMLLIELKKQHYKHILYGFGLLVAIMLLIYINTTFM